MMRSVLILVLLLSSSAYAEEVIAVVDLKFLKDTGETASTLCFEAADGNESCSIWATFYLFEARVQKVVQGEPLSRKFKVWFGRHSLKKGNIRNMVAKLKPMPTEHEATYQIVAVGERKELYCFVPTENQKPDAGIETQGAREQCYDTE